MSADNEASSVKIESVSFGAPRGHTGVGGREEDEGVCGRQGQECGRAEAEAKSGGEEEGDLEAALEMFTYMEAAHQHGDDVRIVGSGASGNADGGGGGAADRGLARKAAMQKMALLPPYAVSGRCCDSTNKHCQESRWMATRTMPEQQLMLAIGSDHCEGTFVELGVGGESDASGVADSLSLMLEKLMGWRGVVVEGDLGKLEAMR